MSKLNPKSIDGRLDYSEKLAGGFGMASAKQSDYLQLRRCVLANLLWEDAAYQDGDLISDRIKSLIPKIDGKLVANLAVECREEQKLRHTPIMILVEMLKYSTHSKYVGEIIPKICTRPDMITDLVALYWAENSSKARTVKNQLKQGPLSKSLVRGVQQTLNNINEYGFGKYNRQTSVKFKDLIFLTHPKAISDEQQLLFNKVISDDIKTPDTWEVGLSTTPKDQHKGVWERLIEENKLGSLAFLRNLRNMKEADVDGNIIRKGLLSLNTKMLLPLNFLSAVKYAPEFSKELEKLMIDGWSQLPKLKGTTVFVVDVSGSMEANMSGKSEFNRMDVAKAMCLLAVNLCENIIVYCTAGSDGRRIHSTEQIKYPSTGFGLFTQIDALKSKLGGGGIFTRQCLNYIKEENSSIKPERIIVFSDSQDCDSSNSVPSPFGIYNYIVDVSNNTHGINYKGVWTSEISGWSEHFISFIAASEGINLGLNNE